MSSTRARDVPKGTGGGPNKIVGKPANKGDHKSDKADLNPKIQPTAEQMQIARIIESHRSEDPELQKKIKQVIEFTRATEDEASMALHSRENNVEEAIALLTEGGAESLESEWAQAGKKRKTKTPGQKNDGLKEGGAKKDGNGIQSDNGPRDRSEKRNDRDSRPDRSDRDQRNNSEQQSEGTFDQRRGGERGRGRGSSRGGRGGLGRGGRIENNKENDESSNNSRGGFVGRFNNGPGRGGRGGREGGVGFRGGRGGGFRGGDRDRDSSRTFASRARGPRDGDFGHHTIDVWENSQADPKAESKKALKVEQWDEFPSAEDWDNEEYTGSLAESKVFTASTLPQTAAGVNSAPTDTVTGGPANLQTETPSNGFGSSANHISGGTNMSATGNSVVAGQSIDLNLLLQKPASAGAAAANANPGVNLLASIQSTYSSAAAQQVPVANNQQPLPPRTGTANKVQPRRGPPTKIPSSGVEMPDENVAKLDVQFGGLDFGTSGSSFNAVVQHGTSKVGGGGGDMLYSNITQPKMDTYSAAAEKEAVQNKPAPPPTSASFQNQQRNAQPAPGSMIIDSLNSKTVPISPNIDSSHSGALSSVQSQNAKVNNVPQSPQSQQQQQQQQPSYANSANSTGSAFVTYNTKPAPGFPAPGFPPVSQLQQTGTYGVPQGAGYGSASNPMIMHQQATAGYHGGLSSYGQQPLVSASVQPSHLQSQQIPSQGGYTQLNNSGYGVPGMSSNPYQTTNAIPNSSTYGNNSTYTGYGAQKGSLTTPGISGKETNDVSSATTSASSGHLGSSATGLQSNTGGTSSTTGSKVPTNPTSVTNSTTAGAAGSKLQSGTNSAMPPGMMMQPQYIVNQAGVPLYGFQGPAMYGYDDSQQMQFLPRMPHPLAAASYYDANAPAYTPGGGVQSTGRADGTSMQGYGADARFSRSDSSTASPVPSNLAGQSTQQMYNLPQAGYYYVGNNMMHPGPFPYGPPTMYPTTAMATPNNPSSGAQHSAANHQYQNKGYGSSYVPPYDTTGQPGNMTDYVNKNTYTAGSGLGGQNSTGKGSASTAGGAQSTEMSSSLYGKGHLNKLNNPYEKQQYGANTGSPYGPLGQQSNPLGGAGMGAGGYSVYMPPPQPDGSSGQRQGGGQPKGGKPYSGQQQQYWSGN